MPITPVGHDAVLAAAGELVGRPLGRGTRALELEMFDLGPEKAWIDPLGHSRLTGDRRLHVQTAWRIVAGDRIVVGYHDYWEPPAGIDRDDFDPSVGRKTRRDELLDRYHAERADPCRTVMAALAKPTGDLTIVLDDGSRLEIRPSGTVGELWRLITIRRTASGRDLRGPPARRRLTARLGSAGHGKIRHHIARGQPSSAPDAMRQASDSGR